MQLETLLGFPVTHFVPVAKAETLSVPLNLSIIAAREVQLPLLGLPVEGSLWKMTLLFVLIMTYFE